MMVKMEGVFRKAWGQLRLLARNAGENPALRPVLWLGAGLLASAASLRGWPQPFALGVVLSLSGAPALACAAGGWLGYRLFWGGAAGQCLWWMAAGGVLAAMGPPKKLRPLLGALVVSAVQLWFQAGKKVQIPVDIALLRCALAAVFPWITGRADRSGKWFSCGLWCLALSQVAPVPGFSLGPAAAAALAVGASFPAAALAGLGVEMSGITAVPMSAVVIFAWLGRLCAGGKKHRWLLPGLSAAGVMALTGCADWRLFPGLMLGGAVGLTLPQAPFTQPRQASTGYAQVRLELASRAMTQLRGALLAVPPAQVDRQALLQRLRSRSCAHCSARRGCLEQQRLTLTALEDSHPFTCRKSARVRVELSRAREQLRLMKADCRRREEYRLALAGQYRYLAAWLRLLSDGLPRQKASPRQRYGVTVGVRTRGGSGANADRWAAFPAGGRYYVLLCDGMGTGPGARREGTSAVSLLKALLCADFPAEYALRSLNAQLAVSGRAGAVTVDLAELRLDTGAVRLYKWGAVPSWHIAGSKAEKIGTAAPPPGISVTAEREQISRLSLRQGEMLILISDGVDGEAVPRRVYDAPDAPPGEVAERLLEGNPGKRADDATAAVIRLYLRNLATS